MGYGLVIIPRQFFNNANLDQCLQNYFSLSADLDEQVEDAKEKLEKVVTTITIASNKVRALSEEAKMTDKMLQMCPLEMVEQNRSNTKRTSESSEKLGDLNRKKLVKMHADLKQGLRNFEQIKIEFNQHLDQTLKLQEIVNCKENSEKKIVGERNIYKDNRYGRFKCKFDWYWYFWFRKPIFYFLFALTAIMSALTIAGEFLLFINDPTTLFAVLVEDDHGDWGTQILCLIQFLYILYATWIPFFKLKFSGKFGIFSNRLTDSPSLLFFIMNLCRLSTPLAYNFLLMMKKTSDTGSDTKTAYEEVYGIIDEVPVFGQLSAEILPAFILLFVFLNLTNFYGRLMNYFGLGSYTYSGGKDEGKYRQGKSVVARYQRVGSKYEVEPETYKVQRQGSESERSSKSRSQRESESKSSTEERKKSEVKEKSSSKYEETRSQSQSSLEQESISEKSSKTSKEYIKERTPLIKSKR